MQVAHPTGKTRFREVQQFRQTWLWVLILSSTAVPLVLVSVLLFRDSKVSALEGLGIIALVAGISAVNIVLLRVTKLETVVTDEGLYYRWRPFKSRFTALSWQEIGTVTVRRYPYMNYGYHKTREYGKVHNIDGNKGVQFELVNGKRIYIGTQKLTALQHAIEQIKPVQVDTK